MKNKLSFLLILVLASLSFSNQAAAAYKDLSPEEQALAEKIISVTSHFRPQKKN